MLRRVFLVVLAGLTAKTSTGEPMYSIQATYLGDQCGGTPYAVTVLPDENCTVTSCESFDYFNHSRNINANMMTNDCSSNYLQVMRDKFDNSPYLLQLLHVDENCTEFYMGFGYPAMGACVGAYNESDGLYAVANLASNGSALLALFLERTCFANQQYMATFVSKKELANHTCTIDRFKWYSSNDAKVFNGSGSASASPEKSGLGPGDTIVIGLSALASALVVVGLIVMRRRQSKSRALSKQAYFDESLTPTSNNSLEAALRGKIGLWDDDIITAKRIPRDKVMTEKLISKGSFGEVYVGAFNGKKVAVKMLMSTISGNIQHVNDFLGEAKMNATMDHPHIVSFIGVAWDSLSDVCVVFEFMEGGELRAMLNACEKTNLPVGFDRQKITIALQVCHALTYLHSLTPPIIHRDLKSRNILLDSEWNAKLSDFGMSRERLDRTMTAGVGTSLWMAPEVMLGEHYDDKADMFSFGVVMSELDVHTMPYSRAKKENLDSNGREMSDSTLLQRVVLGTVQVEFSDESPHSIVELGRACTSMDPTERPSAAEALYRLQLILSRRKLS